MGTQPPILLVFDLSSPLAGEPKIWQEYKRLGTCYLPKVVLEAIQFIADRSAEPQQEKVAREFLKFWPKSGWQQTNASATHGKLQEAEGASLSQQARLNLAIARCAYGVAKERSDALVVFVSNTQPLLKRMEALNQKNLCGITSAMLLQWCRGKKQPETVAQKLERMTTDTGETVTAGTKARSPSKASKKATPRQPAAKRPSPARSQPVEEKVVDDSAYVRDPRRGFRLKRNKPNILAQLTSAIVALAMFTVIVGAIGFMWKMTFPETFNPFWQKQIQPVLRKLPPLPGVK